MWLHVNNCGKGALTCLYHEGGKTGIMFCHQTGGPITVCTYKREGLEPGFYGIPIWRGFFLFTGGHVAGKHGVPLRCTLDEISSAGDYHGGHHR